MLVSIKSVALELVAHYGYVGIFLLSLSAGIYQPIGPDIFIIGEGGIGLNAFLAATVAFGGTLLGSLIGYTLGRWLEKTLFSKLLRRWERPYQRAQALINRYGLWAVVIASISPLPLTQVCWLAGMGRLPLGKFIAALCLGLLPRFFGEALLVKAVRHWLQMRY